MNKTDIQLLLNRNDKAVLRALVVLYGRQTSSEQATLTTKENNGRGFNGVDAPFLSSLAQQHLRGRQLTSKQLFAARKCLKKYSGQLLIVAEERANNVH